MRGGFSYRHFAGFIGWLLLTTGTHLWSLGFADPQALEEQARQALAQKLMKLSQAADMKEASFRDSAGSGKDYNSNDGNSFLSSTTYHSYVWDYCRNWIGGQYCDQWLPAYVSPHAFTADSSPLEQVVGQEWLKYRGVASANQFEIWRVRQLPGVNGPIVDGDGKLNRKALSGFSLLPDVRKKIEDIGERTAIRQMTLTYDESEDKGQGVMPNMEGLREMASRWTKMLRNRMVSIVGELRAAQAGVEFGLGEDKPDCDAYVATLEAEMEQTRTEERTQPQQRLDAETRARDIQERYRNCMALRNAPVNMPNAQAKNNGVQAGDPEEEQVDKWRARVNVALIDRVGLDPNRDVVKPKRSAVQFPEYSSEFIDYEPGGTRQSGRRRLSNAQQLQMYNNQLEQAAASMQAAASRSPNIADISGNIRSYKIQRATRSAVELNGLTDQMRENLAGTPFPRANSRGPASETSPAQVTVRRR